MAGGTLAFLLVQGDEPAKRFDLKEGEDRAIKIGRAAKGNDVVIEAKGCSWFHSELRLQKGASGLELVLRDVSTNGTGLKASGGKIERIEKGVDAKVTDGTTILLPMKVKANSDEPKEKARASLIVRLVDQEKEALEKKMQQAMMERCMAFAKQKEEERLRKEAEAGADDLDAIMRDV